MKDIVQEWHNLFPEPHERSGGISKFELDLSNKGQS